LCRKRFISFRSPSFFYLLVHSMCLYCLFSLDHTETHTTVGRTPLDEGSARRRDLYLTKQTLYKTKKSTPPVGFEPTMPASARPQTYALDGAATRISGKAVCGGNQGNLREHTVLSSTCETETSRISCRIATHLTATFGDTYVWSTHQLTYALNKIHSEAITKLLHVSAPLCHHQGIILNKGVTTVIF
jgi:hypothetical protein